MTQTQRYKYPLHLPLSLRQMAVRLAQEDGVSLNQWIVSAVAQKIGAMESAQEFLTQRASNSKPGDLTHYLSQAPDAPPEKGDEILQGV